MVKYAKRSLSRTKLVFVLTTIFLVAIFFFAYTKINQLLDSSAWVEHTNKVTLCLEKIKSDAFNAEANQKNYLLTGEAFVLAKRDLAIQELKVNLDKADSLLSDSRLQTENLKVLEKLVETKINTMGNVLELYVKGNSSPELREILINGIHIAEEIEDHTNKMMRVEDEHLKSRNESYTRLAYFTPMLIIFLFLGAIFILFAAYYRISTALQHSLDLQDKVNESNMALEKKNRELKESGESYLKMFDNSPVAMSFGEVGTNKIVYTNKVFSEYFGYTKEEAVGRTTEELNLISKAENDRLMPMILGMLDETRSIEEIRKLPADESAEFLEKLKAKMFGNGFEIEYTRKNGTTFYAVVFYEVIAIGAKKFTLISYQDITERKRAEKELAENNERLGIVNRELESFNYIASHDLKEPLRKIQTFGSRILAEEAAGLSDKGKQYFERMQSAAKRMEILIEDLLAFSRTSTSEKKFEMVDLAEVVEEVKADFSDVIAEKNAVLQIGKLPEIRAIRFQIHQLLTNLIGNALKFYIPGTVPVISVTSNIVKGIQTDIKNLVPEKKYCHITITDNGIGFEPEYQERIFDIFQQLNPKEKYGGTGIGLAIVKKIIENHGGAISASGELNKGAKFDIYLPVS